MKVTTGINVPNADRLGIANLILAHMHTMTIIRAVAEEAVFRMTRKITAKINQIEFRELLIDSDVSVS